MKKSVTPARGLEIAAHAVVTLPRRAARDPNGATGECDGPEAASRLVKRVAARPDEACRGRPTVHEGVATVTTFLPSFPVRRGMSRRPPARTTTTDVALFFLPLSLYLSLSSLPSSLPFFSRVTAGIYGGHRPRSRALCIRQRKQISVVLLPELCYRATRLVSYCVQVVKFNQGDFR